MRTLFTVIQIGLAVLLSLLILLQSKGTGISETFGGSGNVYSSKRGVEKFLSIGTVVLAVLFFLNSLAFIYI